MKKRVSLLMVGALLLATAYLSLTIGKVWFTPAELLAGLIGRGEGAVTLTITVFRAPRMLAALLAGAGLGCSGFILQKITQNDLADPGILGINAGAGLTVLVYLGFFTTGATSYTLPLVACAGGLLAALLVYFTAFSKGALIPSRLLLAGIAVNAGISAVTLLATTKVAKDSYSFAVSWLAGTIWGASWQQVIFLAVCLAVTLPWVLIKKRTLAIMTLGNQTAIGLGLSVKKEQLLLLAIAVCQASVSVAVVGSVGFIGLMAPHIAKRLGSNSPESAALIGSLLLSIADVLARLAPHELPTGVVVAILGAPCFAYLLLKNN